jgi:hypothetical protein
MKIVLSYYGGASEPCGSYLNVFTFESESVQKAKDDFFEILLDFFSSNKSESCFKFMNNEEFELNDFSFSQKKYERQNSKLKRETFVERNEKLTLLGENDDYYYYYDEPTFETLEDFFEHNRIDKAASS